MYKYFVTAYDKSGKHLLNDVLEAGDDQAGRENGMKKLEDENLLLHTSRVVNSKGKLLYFHA